MFVHTFAGVLESGTGCVGGDQGGMLGSFVCVRVCVGGGGGGGAVRKRVGLSGREAIV